MPHTKPLPAPKLSIEYARVVSVEMSNNQQPSAVWVETFQQSTCGSCSSKTSCGQGVLNRFFAQKPHVYRVLCEADQAVLYTTGQSVEIVIPQGVVVKAALLAYIAPLIAMCLFAVVAEAFWASDIFSVMAGFSGLGLGFYAVKRYELQFINDSSHQPRILNSLNQ